MEKDIFKIKYNNKDLVESIFNSNICLFIMFIVFFKSSAFDYISNLSMVTNIIIMIECIILSFINLLSKNKSKFFILILLFCLWNYIVAPVFGKNEFPSFYYMIEALGMISFIDISMKVNYKKSLNIMSLVFTLMIIFNFLLSMIYPNGLANEGIYLFGLRTGFSLVIIPGIFLNVFRDYILSDKKFSLRTYTSIIVGTFSLINQWIVTGLIELVIIFVLFFIYCIRKNEKIKINIVIAFIVIMTIDILMTFFGSSNSIIATIANTFNKDITLTGRTYIWDLATKKINNSAIFGYGLNSFVNVFGTLKPAHNNWLNIALEGGYVGLVIYVIAFFVSCLVLSKNKKSKLYNIICIAFIAILIACITEIQIYFPFIYLIFELPYTINFFGTEGF